jgi:hypothetical protein
MKHANAFCGQNSELYFLEADGIYSDYWALNEPKPNIVLLEIIYIEIWFVRHRNHITPPLYKPTG